jgi:phage-related protein
LTEYTISFVELESGNIPFNKFLDNLSLREKAEVLALMEEFRLLKTNNENLPVSMSKHLRDGIFELRVRHENRISRSMYFYYYEKRIMFTHGFIKKTEKTPNTEIKKAIKYRTIYYERMNHEKN